MSFIKTIVEKAADNKAELGLIFGSICMGVGVVTACRATLKLEGIFDEHAKAVEDVKDEYIMLEQTSEEGLTITETISDVKAYKKDLTKVYFSTGAKVCRLYAPTTAIFAL